MLFSSTIIRVWRSFQCCVAHGITPLLTTGRLQKGDKTDGDVSLTQVFQRGLLEEWRALTADVPALSPAGACR
jgi:hypothetical protein